MRRADDGEANPADGSPLSAKSHLFHINLYLSCFQAPSVSSPRFRLVGEREQKFVPMHNDSTSLFWFEKLSLGFPLGDLPKFVVNYACRGHAYRFGSQPKHFGSGQSLGAF